MSRVTLWLAVGAAVVIALFLVNAVAYRIRFGTFLSDGKGPASTAGALSKRKSGAEIAVAIGFVAALLVGYAAPVLAPKTSFAQWLLEPYSRAVYFVWCFIGAVLAAIAISLHRELRNKSQS